MINLSLSPVRERGKHPPYLKEGVEDVVNYFNSGFKNFAVCETLDFTTCSGVPSAII
jgi:hypothetical protein